MVELEVSQLKKELIQIFETCLKDPADEAMKNKAKEIHEKYGNALAVLDKDLQEAVNILVDIGWDLPNPQKPDKERILRIIQNLKADAAR